jgi:ABC-type phosphate transport system substrate-binding protein
MDAQGGQPVSSTKIKLAGVALSLALLGAACGDDGDSEAETTPTTAAAGAATGSTGSGATTTTAKKVEVTGTLAASGATFPKGFYEVVIAEFKKAQPKTNMTYAGGGSG